MHKILVVAAKGMAGHVITKQLQQDPNLQVLGITREDYDLKDHSKLCSTIAEFKPDTVINCAGILVQKSKDNLSEAIYINSYLPNALDQLSKTLCFKLIHISTDCVFNGKKGRYTEQDTPDATDNYGRTKALGEIINSQNLTIRTSIIGPEIKSNGTGLLHWFLNQSGQINGFNHALWSGVTTIELAKFIRHVITNSEAASITGLYHLTNNTTINKYDLLNLFKNTFNTKHIDIKADDKYSVDKSFINTRNDICTSYKVPSYYQMVKDMYEFMLANKELYTHYKVFA